MKKYQHFLSESFLFLVIKFSIYLNRRVFVMHNALSSRGTKRRRYEEEIMTKEGDMRKK